LGSSPNRLSQQGGNIGAGVGMPGCTVAEWPAFEGGLRRGRVFGKGKCSVGSFGYQWKGFFSSTHG